MKNGMKNGQGSFEGSVGVYSYVNGNKYEGELKDDMKSGKGAVAE